MIVFFAILFTFGHGIATFSYESWSNPVKSGICNSNIEIKDKNTGKSFYIMCSMESSSKSYRFPSGIFEIGEQLLIPDYVTFIGTNAPNDMSNPLNSPDWNSQTMFLATRGATNGYMSYCNAYDMVHTRVGFVLSSYVSIHNISFQGVDTVRPSDNGGLCGGGAFETKGCAKNDCSNGVNNGGSDGQGSHHVTIDNVRVNDYFYNEDKSKIGAYIPGNNNCRRRLKLKNQTNYNDTEGGCCFCKPNGVRGTQIAVWIPKTRNSEGTYDVTIKNVVSMSTQADGINLHGALRDVTVTNVYLQMTGDDGFAVWGQDQSTERVLAQNVEVYNPGIIRPNWYGNCVATYGLKQVVFQNFKCREPKLQHPLSGRIDTSMFVFYTSFGAQYPYGNQIVIDSWVYTDLNNQPYSSYDGKMHWTRASNGVMAPYYFPSGNHGINVVIGKDPGPQPCCLYNNQCINDDWCNASQERCLGPCNQNGDKKWGPPGGGKSVCYTKLGGLPVDEGNSVGQSFGGSLESCKTSCTANSRCRSLSYTTNWGSQCFLKDKVLSPSTPTKYSQYYVSYYQTACKS